MMSTTNNGDCKDGGDDGDASGTDHDSDDSGDKNDGGSDTDADADEDEDNGEDKMMSLAVMMVAVIEACADWPFAVCQAMCSTPDP